MAIYRIEVKTGEKDANGVTPTQIVELDLDNLTPLVFSSYSDFPATGDPRHLYVATDTNKLYRFDSASSTYKCVGIDYDADYFLNTSSTAQTKKGDLTVANLYGEIQNARLKPYNTAGEAPNDATTQGWHYVSSENATYNPFISLHTAADFMIESQAYSNARGMQIAKDFRSNNIAIRNHNSGIWSSWEMIAKESWVTGTAKAHNSDMLDGSHLQDIKDLIANHAVIHDTTLNGTGTTATPLRINLANSNTWTASQTVVSATYPVLTIQRNQTSTAGTYGSTLHYRPVALDASYVGEFFATNNKSNGIIQGGFIAGGLLSATAGAEIGRLLFAPSYHGVDPSNRSDFTITAIDSGTSAFEMLGTLSVSSTSTFQGMITASGGITGDLTGTASNASKLNNHKDTYFLNVDELGLANDDTSRLYGVTKDANGKLYVNVPWSSNSNYGADRGVSLIDGKFGHSNTAITAKTSDASFHMMNYDSYGHISGAAADIISIDGGDSTTTNWGTITY